MDSEKENKDILFILKKMEKDTIYPNLYEYLNLEEKFTIDEADLIIYTMKTQGLIELSSGTSRGQGVLTKKGLKFIQDNQ